MPDEANIASLLERVRLAEGADREIDFALAEVVLGFATHDERVFDFHRGWTDKTVKVMSAFGADEQKDWALIPEWSASIDAAIALVERKLPGWCLDVSFENGVGTSALTNPEQTFMTPYIVHASPAMSVIAALLSSMQEEGEGNG